jgi:hypothetical protein
MMYIKRFLIPSVKGDNLHESRPYSSTDRLVYRRRLSRYSHHLRGSVEARILSNIEWERGKVITIITSGLCSLLLRVSQTILVAHRKYFI